MADIDGTIAPNGFATYTLDGASRFLSARSVDDAVHQLREQTHQVADESGETCHLHLATPAGPLDEVICSHQPPPATDQQPAPVPDAPDTAEQSPVDSMPTPPAADDQPDPAPPALDRPLSQTAHQPLADPVNPQPSPQRPSFLTHVSAEQPASQGWRGLLTRMGIRMTPSDAERAQRADIHAVSQHWPGPRTIVVVNGKGGASKTVSVILLATVFARHGGAGVLAWDNNQTRGTLGWRTEQGGHDATVQDLLPQGRWLLGTQAQSADLAHYVHHQTADVYDVLRSQPLRLASEQRITPADVDLLHAVATKYYRLVFVDTGNDESDPVWLRAMEHADQLVVPTTTRDDHAEAGALLLDALRRRDQHSADLAENAVAIVTQADAHATPTEVHTIVDGYRMIAREVVTIPHDPAIVDGVLQWASLQPGTQRAWLRAAAAVAHGLSSATPGR